MPGASTSGAVSRPFHAGIGGAASGELNGTIIALDLLEFEPIEGVEFIQGDFREEAVLARLEQRLGGRRVDVVVSDMAPNLSGIEASDAARMTDLVELAVDFASRHLVADGALVCKVFHGSGHSQLVKLFKGVFRTVKPIKPKASRDKSAETFLVGIGLKPIRSPAPLGPKRAETDEYTAEDRGDCPGATGLCDLKSPADDARGGLLRAPGGPPKEMELR